MSVNRTPKFLQQPPQWSPEERPTFLGSSAVLQHPWRLRIAYLIVGTLVALCGGLGNGLVMANLPQIQGEYGLTPLEATWLPMAYVMANLSANILLFKARLQFGLRWFSEVILLAFMLVILLHLFVHSFGMAIIVRLVSGFVGAPLSSLGLYYVMQGFGTRYRLQSLGVGFGIIQLAGPLSWLISPSLANVNDWTTLYTFELGLAVCCFAMVVALKLPRSIQMDVFEKKDLVTFSLLAPSFALLCLVLTQGTLLWWTNSVMLAYALIAALGFIILGFGFEHFRRNPLIMVRWLGTWPIIRFLISVFLLRFIMTEQSYAVINFLKSIGGFVTEQFVGLYAVILLGMLLGMLVSALTISRTHLLEPLVISVLLIVLASAYDAHQLTSELRAENFYITQFVMAFAGSLCLPPLILIGFGRTLPHGSNHIVTFIILFGACQNFGGLAGSALYSTLQQSRTQVYRQEILQAMDATDANVTQRIRQYQAMFEPTTTDKDLTLQNSLNTLNQVVQREAQVKAYDDVIAMNSYIALFAFFWGLGNLALNRLKQLRQKAN